MQLKEIHNPPHLENSQEQLRPILAHSDLANLFPIVLKVGLLDLEPLLSIPFYFSGEKRALEKEE
jgi:hypothetical protein